MSNLKDIIEQSFTQYSGAVLQSRALVDVRDCLKPSARQIFYCLYTDNFLPSKPYKKTLKAIGSVARIYIHGNSSALGVLMRAGQDFSMRYPLVEVEGNAGDLTMSGNWAADRYTSTRLSEFSVKLFEDIKKNTIDEWRDNYDDTEQYPAVLPSKGFYNIVNGTLGIGIGAASSIPQFNLKEVNEALIHLLWNPDCDFSEIYCAPDFATGAILLNEAQIKESLKNGTGFACKLRSVIEYEPNERCLIVTEIPYGVYTSTITHELEKIVNSEDNPGIDRPNAKFGEQAVNDLTKKTPYIKIYLAKNAQPDKVIKYLYKNTSLQSHYGINMTMLEDGRYPKVYGWKEALQAHLNHEISVYKKGYEFDLIKLKERLHIIDGLLIALASIEEVVQTIKSSASTAIAQKKLTEKFLLDDIQAKAILDMKLSRLAHLEVEKLEKEKAEKKSEIERIEAILNSKDLLYTEIEKGLRAVANKFGDARRTKILNIEGENDEPVEVKQLLINITNKGNLYATETSSLYSQRRGGVGSKFKLENEEYVCNTTTGSTEDTILFFTKKGNVYHLKASELPLNEKSYIGAMLSIPDNEEICESVLIKKNDFTKNLLIITSFGIIKKTLLSEYNINRKGGVKAINLTNGDEIVSVLVTDNDKVGFMTRKGQLMITETKSISAIGRVAKGVMGIKLNEGDLVTTAHIVPSNTKEIISITKEGYIKRTSFNEFTITGRGTKGVRGHLLSDGDRIVDFLPITEEKDVVVVSGGSQIKLKISDIQFSSRGTQGTKAIKLTAKHKVIGIVS